jgi:transcriptional regulator with XRE-family HTH domain
MERTMMGERLKDLRTKYRYTQSDICAFLGVDQSLLSQYESGEQQISTDMLEKLGDLYCCDLVHAPEADLPAIQATFYTDSLDAAGMRSIQAVNRIVLNSMFMVGLLKGD